MRSSDESCRPIDLRFGRSSQNSARRLTISLAAAHLLVATGCGTIHTELAPCSPVYTAGSTVAPTYLTTGYFGVHAIAPRMTWKLTSGRRIDHEHLDRSVVYFLQMNGFARDSTPVDAHHERVFMQPRDRELWSHRSTAGVMALDRTIAIFALEPIVGVVLDRPILSTDSLRTYFAEEVRSFGDCVIPGGIVVGSRFGDDRPTHWFAMGITDGVVPLDQSEDQNILRVGDAAFVLEQGPSGWRVYPDEAP